MDPDKIFGLSKHLARYFTVFIGTLTKPSAAFTPIRNSNEKSESAKELWRPNEERPAQDRVLSPELFVFAAISVLLGSFLFSVVNPVEIDTGVFLRATLMTVLVWVVYSLFIFTALRLSGGKSSALDVVSICLQVYAVAYVVANGVMALWGLLPSDWWISGAPAMLPLTDFATANVYLSTQLILVLVYVPLALSSLERFTPRRLVPVVFVAALLPISVNVLAMEAIEEPRIPLLTSKPAPMTVDVRAEIPPGSTVDAVSSNEAPNPPRMAKYSYPADFY